MKRKRYLPLILAIASKRKDTLGDFSLPLVSASIDIEAAAEGEQRAARVQIDAYNGDVMDVSYYGQTVVDIAGIQAADKVVLLADHRNEIGSILGYGKANISVRKLRIEGQLSTSSPLAASIVAMQKEGIPLQASIGAKPIKASIVEAGQAVRVNGRTIKAERPFYLVSQSKLVHVAIVANGADSTTTVSIAARRQEGNAMGFEAWVSSLGLVLAELSDDRKQELQLAYDALIEARASEDSNSQGNEQSAVESAAGATQIVEASVADPVADMRRQLAAETDRINAIRRIASAAPTIEAQAIRDGWDATRTELEVLRSSRSQGPAIHARKAADQGAAIEASLLLAGGHTVEDSAIAEAGARLRRNGHGLQAAILAAAVEAGYDSGAARITSGNFSEVMRYAGRQIEANFSTFSLPGILSNVMNKSILAAFMGVETTWREIASVASVVDFKPIKRYRLTGNFEYEPLGPTGEMKHGSLGEQEYGNQASTYAKMFSITREDIINDDLRALTDVPRMIGRGAALSLNKVVWTEFLDNASFFTTGRNNYYSGTSAPDTRMNIDGLTQAELAFNNQTDPNGYPLGIQPQILLVPNALFVAATNLMGSLEVRNDAGSAAGVGQYLTQNPHAGKFRVVKSSYLSSSAISGNSAKAWYLLASPQDMPVIEVVFLNGVEVPTVESADAAFNQLGIQMRGYHDFGCEKQEYRGGVKMKGEA